MKPSPQLSVSPTTIQAYYPISITDHTTGGAVNAMAISNRLSRLRKKAADEGFIPRGDAAALTKGRKSAAASKDAKAGKKGGTVVADDSE